MLGSSSDPFRDRPILPPPDAIPGYEIQREVHRGGQGVVYLATQQTTGRKVAIKVLRDGPFADPREVLRFEREMQILSRLEHPNIVRIIDRGIAHDQHWFAMDYIAGPTLDKWLGESRHTRKDVLRLFQKICSAVQSAHVQGVVHRDLKPSNVRVDSSNEPHVLDFGLARTTGDFGGRDQTMTGEFVGTPAWTSPEQLARDPARIDQRTDVYLLGLILFKLLTGKNPTDLGQHRHELLEAMRLGPPAPSTISRDVDDELDTIVGTCLAQERDRRYQSVHALAGDIERYLAGEAIEAKRDSRWYVLGKMAQRYRKTLAAAALCVLLLAIATVVSTVQWRKAERAADAERMALAALQAETAQRIEANAEAARSARMTTAATRWFLHYVIQAADIIDNGSPSLTVGQAIAAGEGEIESVFREEPEQQAVAFQLFGSTYKSLRNFPDSERCLRKALDLVERVLAARPGRRAELEPIKADILEDLGFTLIRGGGSAADREEALRFQQEGLEIRVRYFPPPSVPMAKSHIGIAAVHGRTANETDLKNAPGMTAERLFEAALKHDGIAVTMLSDPAIAAPGPDDPTLSSQLARARHFLGLHLRWMSRKQQGDARAATFARARTEYEASVATYEAENGRDHPVTLEARHNLAALIVDENPQAAVELWEEMIRTWKTKYPGVAGSVPPEFGIADALAFRLDNPRAARPYAESVCTLARERFDLADPDLARAEFTLAFCLLETADDHLPSETLRGAQLAAARQGAERAIEALRAQVGSRSAAHAEALRARCVLLLRDPGEQAAAIAQLEKAADELSALASTEPARRKLTEKAPAWLKEARGQGGSGAGGAP